MIHARDNVLFGADMQIAQWIAERVPGYRYFSDTTCIGIMGQGRLLAGVAYENYNGVHVECTIAAEPGSRWATRRTLFWLFWYPFEHLKCKAISVAIPQSNLASLNLATKLGFRPEAIVAFAAKDGGPLVILKAHRNECGWIDHEAQPSPEGT